MSSYTWDVLPAVGSSSTMESDIRNTLEQWRQNMEDLNDEWDSFDGGMLPAETSTDNAIARFDGVDGTVIQNSLVTIDDTGSINIPTGETYDINGTPHAHDYAASSHTHAYATQADVISLAIALGG